MAGDATRFGAFALLGRPNAGKSQLLNRLVEEPLAIVSSKPQSTRGPVVGVVTDRRLQLAFHDLPGLLTPQYLLQQAMMETAEAIVHRMDGLVFLHPVLEWPPPDLSDFLPEGLIESRPVLKVASKADLRGPAVPGDLDGALPVSSVTGVGLSELLAWCESQCSEAPFRYPEDEISDQPVRFFVAEYLREAAFELLEQELPYALAVEVDEFRESSEPLYIRVTLFVERESQRGMVIGRGGRTIKEMGTYARQRIEQLIGTPVYLDLWVKVLRKWRSKPEALARFGLELKSPRHK